MARFEAFWDVMCSYKQHFWLGAMATLFFLILATYALVFGTPGTAAYLLAIIDFAMSLVLAVLMGGMFYVCHQRETERY